MAILWNYVLGVFIGVWTLTQVRSQYDPQTGKIGDVLNIFKLSLYFIKQLFLFLNDIYLSLEET